MTWQTIAAFFAALFKAVEPYAPALAAFLAGRKWQQADDANDTLISVNAAASAAHRVDVLSDADVVSELKQRGLYRVSDESTDCEQ